MTSELNRESSVRRKLTKAGMTLRKTPARSYLREHYGVGYMVLDPNTKTVILGAEHHAFDANIEDVEALVA